MATILIVEDEIFIQQNAEWTLEDLGHRPLLAQDLAGALAHLSAPPRVDALFVDIRLSKLAFGGYDVANRALALRPGLRVLYTSGSTLSDEMAQQFVQGGQFIQKPYSHDQLAASVTKLLEP
jgi:DNA-binding NtrC family response regulator